MEAGRGFEHRWKEIYERVTGEEADWTAERLIEETFRRVGARSHACAYIAKPKETKLQAFREAQSRKALSNWKVVKRYRFPSVSLASIPPPLVAVRRPTRALSRISFLSNRH